MSDKTTVTLSMPASAAEKFRQGFENKDPYLLELMKEFGIEEISVRPLDKQDEA